MLKSRNKEHNRFDCHSNHQYLIGIRQMQNLKHCTQDNDGCTPAIGIIQYSATAFASQVHLNTILIYSIFSHDVYISLFCGKLNHSNHSITYSSLLLLRNRSAFLHSGSRCRNEFRFETQMYAYQNG